MGSFWKSTKSLYLLDNFDQVQRFLVRLVSWIGYKSTIMPRSGRLSPIYGNVDSDVDKKEENSNFEPSSRFSKTLLKAEKRNWKSYNFERDRYENLFHLQTTG